MSRGTIVRLWSVVPWVVLCTGCFSYSPTREGMPRRIEQTSPPPNWPVQDVAALEPIRAATPKSIYRAHLADGKVIEEIKNEGMKDLVADPKFQVVRNEIVEGVLIRLYQKKSTDWLGLEFLFTGFSPNGSALWPDEVLANSWKLAQWRAARSHESIRAAWAPHGIVPDSVQDDVGIDDGIPFRIPPELPPNCRGIVLHLWALGGNEYEKAVADELASRGWLVVDMKPLNAAIPDMTTDALARIMVLEQESEELNGQLPPLVDGEPYAQHAKRLRASPAYQRQNVIRSEIADLRNPKLRLCEPGDVALVAAAIAQRGDAIFGNNAAAAKAILETAWRVHPSLRGSRVVVMGFSAGALSAPTVAARLLPDVDAVIIVGGAANALGVAMRSVISKGGIRLSCDGKPAEQELVRALEDEYLRQSHFDAFHTAPLLADRPVLVIDAGMDTWVPSDLGEILFQRLGRPDRLHMAMGGHQFLFYFLPRRAAWIADWVARAVDHRAVCARDQISKDRARDGLITHNP